MMMMQKSQRRVVLGVVGKGTTTASATTTTTRRFVTTTTFKSPLVPALQRQQPQQQVITKRSMGGHGHGSFLDHMPVPQSMQAKMFEGHPEGPMEGDFDMKVYYCISFVLIMVAIWGVPDTTIKSWAQTEARTRMALLESGKIDKVEFGRHYYQELMAAGKKVEDWDHRMTKGIKPGDDDDDDDEEEEDDEEEDEE